MVNEDLSLPQRSEGGLAAIDVFYRSYNDFNFYVEDADQENLYFSILKKVFHNVDFAKIFPLGGKPNVLAHSKDPNNGSLAKRIYILDKDFDDLLGQKENSQGLFYLDRFCIENYFLEEEALVEVVVESQPKLKKEEIQEELSLHSKIPEIGGNLETLFALFYLAQLEKLGIANCRQKPEAFCKPRRLWEVCPELLTKYLAELSALCEEQGVAKPAEPLRSDPRLINFYIASQARIVSGKFWLAMLFHHIKSKYNLGSITFDSFVFRTAKSCAFESLNQLVEEVRATYP